jgi:outer membrane protein assembly factor BamB
MENPLKIKSRKKLLLRLSPLLLAVVLLPVLLTGCVRGMTPIGWSGALIDDGKMYVGSREGRLVSLSSVDSSGHWADPLFADQLKNAASGSACSTGSSTGGACGGAAPVVAIYGTPAVANNIPTYGSLVYLAGYNGKIYAYDVSSSSSIQLVWQYPVDTNLSPIVSSIVVANNMIYFGDSDKNVYALDAAKGLLVWKFTTGGEIWSTPAVDANTLVISSFDKKVYGLDAISGQKKWEFATKSTNVAPPVIFNGQVYVGSLDQYIYALNETDGKLVWSFKGGNWFWARPYLYSGVIYAPNLDGNVYALNAASGKLVSTYDVGGQVASWPTAAGNQIVVATENKSLYALDTTSTNGGKKLIGNIPAEVTSPLTASGDIVYVPGPDLNIYPFNVATGQALSAISIKSPTQ